MSGIDEQPVKKLEKPKGCLMRELDLYGKLCKETFGYECKNFVYKVERERVK